MTTVIGGSSPSITFSDSTTQSTAALPLTGGSVSADITVHGLTVGLGNSSVSTNTAVGVSALGTNSSGAYNTAVGDLALTSITSSSNATGVGYGAGQYATGSANTAIGNQALTGVNGSSTGTNNTAIGANSLYANTSGSYNTGLGFQSLTSNNTASNNTAVGYQAGYTNTTGGLLTAFGFQAGYYNTTGNNNTFLGPYAGYTNTTGYNNVFIGYNQGGSSATTNNEILIGTVNGTSGKGASTGFINPNSGGVYQGNNISTWSTTSDQRLKKNIVTNTDGLNKISQLTVRNFEYRLPEEVDPELKPTDALNISGVQLGFIAQELQQILPDCVKTESTGVLGVNIDNVIYHMVNAIKDLNTLVTTQATTIATMQAQIAALTPKS